jgi:hypothetical protein
MFVTGISLMTTAREKEREREHGIVGLHLVQTKEIQMLLKLSKRVESAASSR